MNEKEKLKNYWIKPQDLPDEAQNSNSKQNAEVEDSELQRKVDLLRQEKVCVMKSVKT